MKEGQCIQKASPNRQWCHYTVFIINIIIIIIIIIIVLTLIDGIIVRGSFDVSLLVHVCIVHSISNVITNR